MRKIAGLAALLLLIGGTLATSVAEDNFYRGKTVRLVVGAQAGASYDIYSRLIARHMGKHIPGEPTIVVQNMNSAGGLAAANYLYNGAAKDGTVIGTFQRSLILIPSSKIQWRNSRLRSSTGWGPRPAWRTMLTSSLSGQGLPYTTIDDLRKAEPPIAVGVVNSPTFILKAAFGLSVKIIPGYGKNALDLAFERGEVDGEGITYANLLSRRPQWVTSKLARPMI